MLIGLPEPVSTGIPVAVVPEYMDQLNTVPVCGEVKTMFALPADAASGPEHGVGLFKTPVAVGVGLIVTFAIAVPPEHEPLPGNV